MKKQILYILLILPIFGLSQTVINAGNVSGTWNLQGSPYQINGNILVPNNEVLTIEPGVVIEFMGKYKLFCNGSINAQGTEEQNIIFTSSETNTQGWIGIKYEDTPVTNAPSIFEYCQISKIKADVVGSNAGAVNFLNYSNCTFENCLFEDNFAEFGGGAILCDNSDIQIKNSTFINNLSTTGGSTLEINESDITIDGNYFTGKSGIYSYKSNLVIINNKFENIWHTGGITSFGGDNGAMIKSIEIKNNIFENNRNENGGGGGAILLFDMEGIIQNNTFKGNTTDFGGGAITCTRSGDYPQITNLYISNNLFYENTAGSLSSGLTIGGGAITFRRMSPIIVNNTMVNNVTDNFGGAIFCDRDSDPLFYNNIIYNNITNDVDNIFINDNDSNPSFYHNNIQGEINTNGNPLDGEWVGNINVVPFFTNAEMGDYTLLSNSECINAGYTDLNNLNIPEFDLNGNPRIKGGIIDMGAYEFQTLGVEDFVGNAELIQFYPNPTLDYINFSVSINKIRIYTLDGTLVLEEKVNGNKLNISHMKSGVYNAQLFFYQKVKSVKIIKID